MEFRELVQKRHSVRGYLKDPVPKEKIEELLTLASRAVSSQNTQPWHFVVVAGEVIEDIRRCNMEDFNAEKPLDFRGSTAIDGVYKDRARVLGKELFRLMGIARDDREARRNWRSRGFRFFDAPVVILIYTLDDISSAYHRLDVGCVVQNICLAATDMGLGSCAADQAIYYQRGIEKHLKLPENAELQAGIALGYEDPDFPGNKIRSEREELSVSTEWYGF